jgi:hypothetical protein
MREAGAPDTRKLLLRLVSWCARPTEGSHGRITDNSAQRTTRQSEGRAKHEWEK